MFGNKFTSGLFCALLLAGTVSGLILPDKTYSALEKRKLAQKPVFSAKNLFSGGFGSDLESYLADQFPARDSWVTAKTFAELASGKRESGAFILPRTAISSIGLSAIKRSSSNRMSPR